MFLSYKYTAYIKKQSLYSQVFIKILHLLNIFQPIEETHDSCVPNKILFNSQRRIRKQCSIPINYPSKSLDTLLSFFGISYTTSISVSSHACLRSSSALSFLAAALLLPILSFPYLFEFTCIPSLLSQSI